MIEEDIEALEERVTRLENILSELKLAEWKQIDYWGPTRLVTTHPELTPVRCDVAEFKK